jgi:carboxyl-terminal processing protease
VPDIAVEEATVNTADQGMNLREADLSRHLANPKDGDTAPAEQPAKPAVPAPANPDSKDKPTDKPIPTEPGSKSDYQFNQALNLLKGLQFIQRK